MVSCRRYVANSEDLRNVFYACLGVQAGLGVGAACTAEDIRPYLCSQRCGQFFCNYFCLVVPSSPFPMPVEGNGDDQIYVFEGSPGG